MRRQTDVCVCLTLFFFTTIVLTGINTCGCFFDNATELLTYMQTDRRVWVFLRQYHWHIDRCADRQACLDVFATKLLADLNNCWWFYYGDTDTHSDTCANRQTCSGVFITKRLADIDTYADRDMSDPENTSSVHWSTRVNKGRSVIYGAVVLVDNDRHAWTTVVQYFMVQ